MDPFTIALLAGGQIGTGLLQSYFNRNAARDAANAQARAADRAMAEQRNAYGDVQGIVNPYIQQGNAADQEMQNAYKNGYFDVGGKHMSLYGDMPDFNYGSGDYATDVQKFLDPSMQYQQQNAQRALEQSAAAGGGLTSGATMKALQNQAEQYAQQDFGNAANRMTADRQFNYNDFLNRFKQQRQNVANRTSQLQGLSNHGFNASTALANARVGAGTNISDLLTGQGNAQAVHDMANPLMYANMAGTAGKAIGMGTAAYGASNDGSNGGSNGFERYSNYKPAGDTYNDPAMMGTDLQYQINAFDPIGPAPYMDAAGNPGRNPFLSQGNL